MQQTHCYATGLLRYYGNATRCICHVTKGNLICNNMLTIKANAVPLHVMQALEWRGGIDPAPSRPRH
jgi:hypothetical protein